MNVPYLRSRIAPLLALGWLLGLTSGMASSQLDSLLANSPFGTVKTGPAGDAAGNQPLEFRGTSEEGGQQYFSIYDTATKRSRWVTLNAASDDFVVKSYDPDAHTVSLDQHGRVLALTLKSGPRIVQNVPPPMPPNTANLQPGQMQPGGVGKGPEAQRLQQIAEEIRRRRALRQQPAQMPMPNPNVAPGSVGPNFIPGAGTGGPMPIPGAGTGPGPMPTPVSGANSGPTLIPNYQPKP